MVCNMLKRFVESLEVSAQLGYLGSKAFLARPKEGGRLIKCEGGEVWHKRF
jgi:hypothetical protein